MEHSSARRFKNALVDAAPNAAAKNVAGKNAQRKKSLRKTLDMVLAGTNAEQDPSMYTGE